MNVFFTGDLHFGITSDYAINQMIEHALEENVDLFILIGDLAESRISVSLFETCMDFFCRTKIPALVIPGNHDLWVESRTGNHGKQNSSRKLYDKTLKGITEDKGGIWLETTNHIIGKIGFVGSYLHYDYSARDNVGVTNGLSDDYFHHNRSSILNDGTYMPDITDDRKFAKEVGQSFQKRLKLAQNNPDIETIVVATHVPCMECQITRRPFNYSWSVATPFFGNLSHQHLLLSSDKVKYIVSGHSHQGSENIIEHNNRKINIINLSSDYGKPSGKMLKIGI